MCVRVSMAVRMEHGIHAFDATSKITVRIHFLFFNFLWLVIRDVQRLVVFPPLFWYGISHILSVRNGTKLVCLWLVARLHHQHAIETAFILFTPVSSLDFYSALFVSQEIRFKVIFIQDKEHMHLFYLEKLCKIRCDHVIFMYLCENDWKGKFKWYSQSVWTSNAW